MTPNTESKTDKVKTSTLDEQCRCGDECEATVKGTCSRCGLVYSTKTDEQLAEEYAFLCEKSQVEHKLCPHCLWAFKAGRESMRAELDAVRKEHGL